MNNIRSGKVLKNFKNQIIFDENLNEQFYLKVNDQLKKYIGEQIIDEYKLNDEGHNINHINYVLKRAIEISQFYSVNINILYTCVMFHDITCHINRDFHEKLSAERAYHDKFLQQFFSSLEMNMIKEAIEDHRASLQREPRNLYGKILSSADRKVDIYQYLHDSISYDIKKNPTHSKQMAIMNSYEFAIKKYGKDGYAIKKIYVNDEKYKQFLNHLQYLIENKNQYFEIASDVYDKIRNQ